MLLLQPLTEHQGSSRRRGRAQRSLNELFSDRFQGGLSILFYCVLAVLLLHGLFTSVHHYVVQVLHRDISFLFSSLSVIIVRFVLWGAVGICVLQVQVIRRQIPKVSRRIWGILFACVMILLLAGHYIPHSVWHSNSHGISIVAEIRNGPETIRAGGLSSIHGHGYDVLMKDLYHVVFMERLSVFSINYLLSVLSVIVLFFVVYVLINDERVALLSALFLAFLPVHLRLAATECTYIPVELYYLLMLFFIFLFIRTSRPRWFLCMLPWAFLMMQTRQELMLLAPLSIASSFLLFTKEQMQVLRSDKRILAVMLFFGILFVPRIFCMLYSPDHRSGELMRQLMLSMVWLRDIAFEPAVRAKFNVFFVSTYTPATYVLFFVVGLFVLVWTYPKLLSFLLVNIILFSFFYLPYWDGISTFLRTGLMTQFMFMIIMAAGVDHLLKLLRNVRAAPMLCAGLMICTFTVVLVSYRGFLLTIYSVQQEYAFLENVDTVLPKHARLVYFSRTDDPNTTGNKDYQIALLGGRSGRTFMGISEYLGASEEVLRGDTYFLLGAPCYKVSIPIDILEQQRTSANAVPNDFIQPLSKKMLSMFVMVPVLDTVISRNNMSIFTDVITGDTARLVLYKIVGRK